VQEALTNVVRHAEASEVSVSIDETEDGIRLVIEDDGKGFNVAAGAPGGKKTFGVLGMRERAAILDGSLDIESHPGTGTRITGWLPFPKETSS
jgi:signal transduction histidine kinase